MHLWTVASQTKKYKLMHPRTRDSDLGACYADRKCSSPSFVHQLLTLAKLTRNALQAPRRATPPTLPHSFGVIEPMSCALRQNQADQMHSGTYIPAVLCCSRR